MAVVVANGDVESLDGDEGEGVSGFGARLGQNLHHVDEGRTAVGLVLHRRSKALRLAEILLLQAPAGVPVEALDEQSHVPRWQCPQP